MQQKLYEYFLSRYKYDDKNSSEFNFRFNQNYSIKKFDEEFNKFIYLVDSTYYENNKMVTAINSLDIIIPKKLLKHFIKLYVYSSNNNLEQQKYIIADFLLTYYNTIQENKKEQQKYKKIEKQYIKLMEEFKLRTFYKQFVDECSIFYPLVTEYGIKQDLYIAPEVVTKMINNIRNKNKRNLLIEKLLKSNKYYFIIIKYDQNVTNHKSSYLNFIIEILRQDNSLNDINGILKVLINNNSLVDKEIKNIVNLYITKTNNLCNKYKKKTEKFIGYLSETETLKNNLIEVLNIEKLNKKYKDKLHECIINILSLKRYILLDEEYIISDMHEFNATTTISNEIIEQFIKEIEENKYKLYSTSSLDFDKSVEDSVKNYSEHAIHSLFQNYTIDSKTQTYFTNDAYITEYKYSFEKYYERIGEEYTKKNYDKLLNKIGKGYYIEMLRDLSQTFNMHQSITLSILGEERFASIISELKKEIGNEKNNDYQSIVGNILAIEVNINKLLTKNNKKYTENMVSNLDVLFETYIDNKKARNGIMYLYYSLYEHTGLNLRNKAMHGTLFNEDLKIPLLVSFSGLIFTSWLLNE